MFRFLSKIRLTTKVYAGFLFVGFLAVVLCFTAILSMGAIHGEYAKSDAAIELSRQVAALETDISAFDRELFFFSVKGGEDEKNKVVDAFRVFREKAEEAERSLSAADSRKSYSERLTGIVRTVETALNELTGLYDRSAESAEKVERYAVQATKKVSEMIDEATLPSASFVLNSLKEQMASVLKTVDAATDGPDARSRLPGELDALKKAVSSARQAEMINAQQIKKLDSAVSVLDSEIRKKLKIDASLREKTTKMTQDGAKTVADIKALTDELNAKSGDFIAKAGIVRVSLQKMFVFAAALCGFLAALTAFLTLYGFRHPLAQLIENAYQLARGNRNIVIHYTDRPDELGVLAGALSDLAALLKSDPFLNEQLLSGFRPDGGESSSYIPLGAPPSPESAAADPEKGDTVAYFGRGAGVDAESQLYQMLALIQKISVSTTEVSDDMKNRFSKCSDLLRTVIDASGFVRRTIDDLAARAESMDFALTDQHIKQIETGLATLSAGMESLTEAVNLTTQSEAVILEQSAQMRTFAADLIEWTRCTTEMAARIRQMAADSKIAALNASIEAAKIGDKTRKFGDIVQSIRHNAQLTEDNLAELDARLTGMRRGTEGFGAIIATAAAEAEKSTQNAVAVQSIVAENANLVMRTMHVVQTLAGEDAALEGDRAEIAAALRDLPAHLADAEEIVPQIEGEMSACTDHVGELLAVLPTFEEERDPDS